jgi:hypothetical protein
MKKLKKKFSLTIILLQDYGLRLKLSQNSQVTACSALNFIEVRQLFLKLS